MTMILSGKPKKTIAIIFGLLIGLMATVFGGRELRNSIALSKHGKKALAEVVNGWDQASGKLRRHSYTLVIAFQPEGAQRVQKPVGVSEAIYKNSEAGGTVPVVYLPDNPEICAAGEKVEIRYFNLLFGIAMLGVAGYLILGFKQPLDKEEAVQSINAKLEPLMTSHHEYAPADPKKFKQLDLAFYEQTQKLLEQRGYRFTADTEDLTVGRAFGARTFVRGLLSKDGTVMASMFHFKPAWWLRLLGVKDVKTVCLENWYSDGRFLCTSNTEAAGRLESPPEVDALHLPAGASIETVLQAHQQRLEGFAAKFPQVRPVILNGAADVLRAQRELDRIKAEFRRKKGLSKRELAQIAGKSEHEVAELHAALGTQNAEPRKTE